MFIFIVHSVVNVIVIVILTFNVLDLTILSNNPG